MKKLTEEALKDLGFKSWTAFYNQMNIDMVAKKPEDTIVIEHNSGPFEITYERFVFHVWQEIAKQRFTENELFIFSDVVIHSPRYGQQTLPVVEKGLKILQQLTVPLLLFFACAFSSASAQVSIPVYLNTGKQALTLTQPSTYEVIQLDSASGRVSFQYAKENSELFAQFTKTNKGFRFTQLSGPYDLVAAFWKKNIDNNATDEQLKAPGDKVVLWPEAGLRLVLRRTGNEWFILTRLL